MVYSPAERPDTSDVMLEAGRPTPNERGKVESAHSAQAGHRLQVDVKFLERRPATGRRLYQFTAIDDCTRIRVFEGV